MTNWEFVENMDKDAFAVWLTSYTLAIIAGAKKNQKLDETYKNNKQIISDWLETEVAIKED